MLMPIIRLLSAAVILNLLPGTLHAQSAETDAALELYRYKLYQTGMKISSYPEEAIARGEEGTVTVEIRMNADGSLAGALLIESSGHAPLDHHALDLLARAVPMTDVPPALHNRPFTFRVAMAFALPK